MDEKKPMDAFRKLAVHLTLNLDEAGLDLLNEGLEDIIEFMEQLKEAAKNG